MDNKEKYEMARRMLRDYSFYFRKDCDERSVVEFIWGKLGQAERQENENAFDEKLKKARKTLEEWTEAGRKQQAIAREKKKKDDEINPLARIFEAFNNAPTFRSYTLSTYLKDVPVGETFLVGDEEFIVLEHFGRERAFCISRNLVEVMPFNEDGTNNFNNSTVSRYLKEEYYPALKQKAILLKPSSISFLTDLIANDGRTEYGKQAGIISLLTAEQYRKYVYILDKYKLDNCWWLATPFSTLTDGYSEKTMLVTKLGTIDFGISWRYASVRPVIMLDSSAKVTLKKTDKL